MAHGAAGAASVGAAGRCVVVACVGGVLRAVVAPMSSGVLRAVSARICRIGVVLDRGDRPAIHAAEDRGRRRGQGRYQARASPPVPGQQGHCKNEEPAEHRAMIRGSRRPCSRTRCLLVGSAGPASRGLRRPGTRRGHTPEMSQDALPLVLSAPAIGGHPPVALPQPKCRPRLWWQQSCRALQRCRLTQICSDACPSPVGRSKRRER